MKDLNDLMQAILDMDAAQRKATEAAKAERAEQLGRLDAQRRAIADDFAAKAQARSQAGAPPAAAAPPAAPPPRGAPRGVFGPTPPGPTPAAGRRGGARQP